MPLPPHSYERHGMTGHPFYKVWNNMLQRCQNPNDAAYHNYGGRGITVCERWESFINFRNDMLDTYLPGLTIERIFNDGNYTPENCRFATRSDQNRNQRVSGVIPFRGVSKNGKHFAAKLWDGNVYKHLGTFKTPEAASAAYEAAREQIK